MFQSMRASWPKIKLAPRRLSSPAAAERPSKVTVTELRRLSSIAMVTAYDTPSAACVDAAGIDACLIGDSVGMAVLGYSDTIPVTMADMIHHCRAVARGSQRCFRVGDLPFGSYEASPDKAVESAVCLMKDGLVDAVKLEGDRSYGAHVALLTKAGIPVVGHIGLTPQRYKQLGGFRSQGTTSESAMSLLDDAHALEEAGCSAIVIEAVPSLVASHITSQIGIPTIGIGSGNGCTGQVLVWHDMLGWHRRTPRFVKTYAAMADLAVDALKRYKQEVAQRVFPDNSLHTYAMRSEEEEAAWRKLMEDRASRAAQQ